MVSVEDITSAGEASETLLVNLKNSIGMQFVHTKWIKGYLGSITRRCSANEPALLPQKVSSRGGTKTGHERAAEIEPKGYLDII